MGHEERGLEEAVVGHPWHGYMGISLCGSLPTVQLLSAAALP